MNTMDSVAWLLEVYAKKKNTMLCIIACIVFPKTLPVSTQGCQVLDLSSRKTGHEVRIYPGYKASPSSGTMHAFIHT